MVSCRISPQVPSPKGCVFQISCPEWVRGSGLSSLKRCMFQLQGCVIEVSTLKGCSIEGSSLSECMIQVSRP